MATWVAARIANITLRVSSTLSLLFSTIRGACGCSPCGADKENFWKNTCFSQTGLASNFRSVAEFTEAIFHTDAPHGFDENPEIAIFHVFALFGSVLDGFGPKIGCPNACFNQ